MRIASALLAAFASACVPQAKEAQNSTAQAQIALSTVPADVSCLDILVLAAGHAVDQRFDVTPGASATLSVFAPPDEQASISAQAFPAACSAVTATTPASWVADPQTVALTVGAVAQVHLHMRRASQVAGAQVTVDFPGASSTSSGLIAANGSGVCTVKQDSTVACWGATLGNVSLLSLTARPLPGLSSVQAIVGGGTVTSVAGPFVCALLQGGTVSCWGDNSYGQLGTNSATTAQSTTPRPIANLSGVTALSAGGSTVCALKQDGTVVCWGRNLSSVLGSVGVSSFTPVSIPGLTNAVALAGSNYNFCALKADSTVACWGGYAYDVLGNGLTSDQSTPVAIAGLAGSATAISLPGSSPCALLADTSVQCWGHTLTGAAIQDSGTPQTLAGLSGVVALGVNGNAAQHECAIKSDASVSCWGANFFGQAANSSAQAINAPTPVSGVTGATAVALGDSSTCALTSDGSVWCWGWNSYGKLGNNSTIDSKAPVRVVGLP